MAETIAELPTDAYECPCCEGTGRIPLTGIYRATLKMMRQFCRSRDSFIVANRDAERFGCEPTALNNRLARLEEMGFVFSERFGRQRRFYLCVTKGK